MCLDSGDEHWQRGSHNEQSPSESRTFRSFFDWFQTVECRFPFISFYFLLFPSISVYFTTFQLVRASEVILSRTELPVWTGPQSLSRFWRIPSICIETDLNSKAHSKLFRIAKHRALADESNVKKVNGVNRVTPTTVIVFTRTRCRICILISVETTTTPLVCRV